MCGPKHDGEAYAPDETDALAALAHGVAGALVLLEARDGREEAQEHWNAGLGAT